MGLTDPFGPQPLLPNVVVIPNSCQNSTAPPLFETPQIPEQANVIRKFTRNYGTDHQAEKE